MTTHIYIEWENLATNGRFHFEFGKSTEQMNELLNAEIRKYLSTKLSRILYEKPALKYKHTKSNTLDVEIGWKSFDTVPMTLMVKSCNSHLVRLFSVFCFVMWNLTVWITGTIENEKESHKHVFPFRIAQATRVTEYELKRFAYAPPVWRNICFMDGAVKLFNVNHVSWDWITWKISNTTKRGYSAATARL